jgi:hypothetical protein
MNSRNRKTSSKAALNGMSMGETAIPMTTEEWDRQAAESAERELQQIGATINVLGPQIAVLMESLSTQIHRAMVIKGFWEGAQDNFGSKIALLHSEVTELLEANRNNIQHDDKIPEFTGEEAEAADTFIRLADMSGNYRWRFGEAIVAKMLHNLSRPYKHGKAY